jgi:hypothetical protein
MWVEFPPEYGLSFRTLTYHHAERNFILALSEFTIEDSFAAMFHPNCSIEDTLATKPTSSMLSIIRPHLVPVTHQEKAIRAALNLNLLLHAGGFSTTAEETAATKRAKLQVNKHKPQAERRRGQQTLREQFHFLNFDQDIKVWGRKAYQALQESERGQRRQRPHWRRGHIRQQAFGPKFSQHRAIRIPPVLIHPDLFGDPSSTTVTYRS